MLVAPTLPESQSATVTAALRYEDVSQDGHLSLLALPHFVGLCVWVRLINESAALQAAARAGIIPILSRVELAAGEGRVTVGSPITATGGWKLAHTEDATGEVDRVVMNMWVEMTAPARDGEPRVVGRVFAEHVMTRPFAPREQRRVVRLELPGVPAVPPELHTFRPPEELLAAPAGATFLDDALVADEARVVFGLAHTDSNQHVNSLVYPRLLEEAALRRLVFHGRSARVLARRTEVAYRKPCFAGDRMRMLLRAFEQGQELGVVGVFVPDDEPTAKPHAVLRIVLAA